MSGDEQLRDDVLLAIRGSQVANATAIAVGVRNGVVTLTGRLNNHVEQWNLEKSMRDVTGIAALDFDVDYSPFWLNVGSTRNLAR